MSLSIVYYKMGTESVITIDRDPKYIPVRGDLIDFRDFQVNLEEWEKKVESWRVEEVKFKFPSVLYISVFKN